MLKITININGTDHDLNREEALRIHAELSVDLGLNSTLPPLGPAPYQPVSPWTCPHPGTPWPLQPSCNPSDPIWLVDQQSLPRYVAPPATITSDSLRPEPPAPTLQRPAPTSSWKVQPQPHELSTGSYLNAR